MAGKKNIVLLIFLGVHTLFAQKFSIELGVGQMTQFSAFDIPKANRYLYYRPTPVSATLLKYKLNCYFRKYWMSSVSFAHYDHGLGGRIGPIEGNSRRVKGGGFQGFFDGSRREYMIGLDRKILGSQKTKLNLSVFGYLYHFGNIEDINDGWLKYTGRSDTFLIRLTDNLYPNTWKVGYGFGINWARLVKNKQYIAGLLWRMNSSTFMSRYIEIKDFKRKNEFSFNQYNKGQSIELYIGLRFNLKQRKFFK